MVGDSLYLHLCRLSPFPTFLFLEQRWWFFQRKLGNCTNAMHHLRAASGERSNRHVGLAATTPPFEVETYRKVCRMGRDAPFSAKMNHAHLHQEGILGHPSWHVPMALFLQVSSSLAPMQVCWRMLHCPAAKPRVATGQGREVFFPRHKCSVERTEYLMRFFCLVISIYLYI